MRISRAGWALFGLAVMLSLAWVLVGWRTQPYVANASDPYAFGLMEGILAEGKGFVGFGVMLKRRAPLYPLMIGGIYSVFGESPLAVKIVQCVLFAGVCLFAYDIGRRLFNERTGLIAGVCCAVHPIALRYVADLHLETLLTFLATACIWATVRYWERPTVGNGVVVGALAGLASLTKAVFAPYCILFAIGMLLWGRRGPDAHDRTTRVKLGLVAAVLAMAAVILPWTLRNYLVTGKVIPISTGLSDAFLRGYVFSKPEYALLRRPPYTDAENESNAMFRALAVREGTVWERNDVETDQILNKAAKERLLSDPAAFVRKFVVGLFAFWYEMTTLRNSLVAGLSALVVWGFAMIGWRRSRIERKPAWLLLLPVIFLNVILAALLALGRYSAPVTPALAIMGAYGLDGMLKRRQAPVRHEALAEPVGARSG